MKAPPRRKRLLAGAALASLAVLAAPSLRRRPAAPSLAPWSLPRGRALAAEEFRAGTYVDEADYDAAVAAAFDGRRYRREDGGGGPADRAPPAVAPYTLGDAYAESAAWEYTFCVLIYDPEGDNFVVAYSKDHVWKNGNRKLFHAVRELAYLLRSLFPERFAPGSPEFAVAVGGGDYPHVNRWELPRTEGVAPVLMFGSAFREEEVYPNMVPMPLPTAGHLPCFVEWVQGGKERGEVCEELRPKTYKGKWKNLIPQLIWRGTDFSFLPSLQPLSALAHIDSRGFVRPGPEADPEHERARRRDAVRALNAFYDRLLPRWKGVALSADAELEAEEAGGAGALPWADVRFSSYYDQGKATALGSPRFGEWESVGIAAGAGMSREDLARYRYHIDLGGGGGTTWSGTLEKLAMPGLLFHHVTPTKDYYHDHMVPWKHYVPVGSDLKDLRRKFDWAEAHPRESIRIANAGRQFARWLGTPEGFGRVFEQDLKEPLRAVIEAYQPVEGPWREAFQSIGRLLPIMECSGASPVGSCSMAQGEDVKRFQATGRYTAV